MQNHVAACFRPPDRDQTVRRATNCPSKVGRPTPSVAQSFFLVSIVEAETTGNPPPRNRLSPRFTNKAKRPNRYIVMRNSSYKQIEDK
jgi:hypothetical protein